MNAMKSTKIAKNRNSNSIKSMFSVRLPSKSAWRHSVTVFSFGKFETKIFDFPNPVVRFKKKTRMPERNLKYV